MAKIIKKNLTRGTKLAASVWNDNKNVVGNLLSDNIDNENLTRNKGSFSVTYNWPRLRSEDFAHTNEVPHGNARYVDESQGIYAIVILPPTQDRFIDEIGTYPMPILRGLSVSFDNFMSNVGVLNEAVDGSAFGPFLAPLADAANRYTCNIQIREKDNLYVIKPPGLLERAENIASKTIYKTRVEGIFFNNPTARFNPFFVTAIDKVFNPKKTYLVKLDFPQIFGMVEIQSIFPVSLTLKLDFDIGTVPRDVYDKDEFPIQNFPIDQQTVPAAVSLDTAVAGETITASAGLPANGRVGLNLASVDSVLLAGMKSGYDLRSYPPKTKYLQEDASYFCIAVPMFSGNRDTRALDLNVEGLPYGDQGPFNTGAPPFWNGLLYDQRLIPISQPLVIHNVMAVHDYGSHEVTLAGAARPRPLTATVPASDTFRERIGVGIASGLRSESKRYEQVAYLEYQGSQKFAFVVDQVVDGLIPPGFGNMTSNGDVGYQCDQEIFQVPLVQNSIGGAGTRSYYAQGFPYYVGKSDLNTRLRTEVGVLGGGTRDPLTKGEELYLDCRWVMDDSAPSGLSWVLGDPKKPISTQYIGTSKCWILITGKMATAI
jgi:hypothetical protein